MSTAYRPPDPITRAELAPECIVHSRAGLVGLTFVPETFTTADWTAIEGPVHAAWTLMSHVSP